MSHQILPRPDLQEPAFRKYERFISRACFDEIIIDPSNCFKRPMSAQSFCNRFRDATRAYRLFKYKSDLIPKDFDTTQLKCFALANGSVLVKAPALTKISCPKISNTASASNESEVRALFQHITENQDPIYIATTKRVTFTNTTELTLIHSLMKEYPKVSGEPDSQVEGVF